MKHKCFVQLQFINLIGVNNYRIISKYSHYSHTNTTQFVPYTETVAVCSETHQKNTQKHCLGRM